MDGKGKSERVFRRYEGGMKAPRSSVCSQGAGSTEMMWQHSEGQSLLKELKLAWPARRACLI